MVHPSSSWSLLSLPFDILCLVLEEVIRDARSARHGCRSLLRLSATCSLMRQVIEMRCDPVWRIPCRLHFGIERIEDVMHLGDLGRSWRGICKFNVLWSLPFPDGYAEAPFNAAQLNPQYLMSKGDLKLVCASVPGMSCAVGTLPSLGIDVGPAVKASPYELGNFQVGETDSGGVWMRHTPHMVSGHRLYRRWDHWAAQRVGSVGTTWDLGDCEPADMMSIRDKLVVCPMKNPESLLCYTADPDGKLLWEVVFPGRCPTERTLLKKFSLNRQVSCLKG